MFRFIAVLVVLVALIALPVYAQQSGLTLESLSSRIDVLFSGQTYLTQRIAALETTVAISSQRQVVALPTMTPVPTLPSPTPSFTPLPTNTPVPSSTPSPVPSATLMPIPAQARAVINRRAMIRRGPGNNHAVVATANVGDEFMVSGKNLNRTWWQIEHEGSSAWISDSYVDTYGIENVQIAFTPTPLPSPTVEETSTPVPTATPETIPSAIWDLLEGIAFEDIENATGEVFNEERMNSIVTQYFTLLGELGELCNMTRIDLASLINPYGARIDKAGISERTGYYARYSLIIGMKDHLTENRETNCTEYISDYTDWILWNYREDE